MLELYTHISAFVKHITSAYNSINNLVIMAAVSKDSSKL